MNLRKHVSKVITFSFLGAFIWYGFANPELFTGLKDIALLSLFLVAIGRLAIYFNNGLFTKWSTEAFTRKLTVGEGFYVGILSAIGNFFGPLLGGTSIRAVYLKKVHNLSYAKFTATLMGYYLILFTVNCSMAILSISLLRESQQTASLLLFFGVWLALLLALLFVRMPSWERFMRNARKKYTKFVFKTLVDIEKGWQLIQRDKKLLRRLITLAFLGFLTNYFVAFIEFQAIGVSISPPALGLYAVLVTVSLLVSLTPGAIGIREAILLLVSSTLGVTNQEILQVAVIDRGVNFALLFVLFALTRSGKLKRKYLTQDAKI